MDRTATSLNEVIELFNKYGAESYGEAVTQLEHALQCAVLAQRAKASNASVAAALLHDIGHFLIGVAPEMCDSDIKHERIGAQFLSGLFGSEVTEPIAQHVTAKRYQCTTRPDYHDMLSLASRRSFVQQGGLLSADEVASFAAEPYFQEALQLRAWDDSGKVDDMILPDLASFMPLLEGLLKEANSTRETV